MISEDKKPENDDFEEEQPWRPAQEELAEPELFVPGEALEKPAEDKSETPGGGGAGDTISEIPAPQDQAAEGADAADQAEGLTGEGGAQDVNQQPAAAEVAAGSPTEPPLEITTRAVIEAVLFATTEPVTPQKLAEIIGTGTAKEVRGQIDELNERYRQQGAAFRIEGIAGGYQMLTLPEFNPWLKKLLKVRAETKLSPAALEALAIIAYKQPVMRVDIEAIRGVACGEMVRQLSEKGLVKIVGRAEELGRPLLYGTTRKFLEVFGLNSLKDLPTAEDLKKPAE